MGVVRDQMHTCGPEHPKGWGSPTHLPSSLFFPWEAAPEPCGMGKATSTSDDGAPWSLGPWDTGFP